MKMATVENIKKVWPGVADYLSVPHDEESYNRLLSLIESLIDEIGEDDNHPLVSLMETLGILVSEYEDEHYHVPEASPESVLKYLMTEHGLNQSDLSDIGTQGVVSEILSGKRELNIRQIQVLSRRFNVSPVVFMKREI